MKIFLLILSIFFTCSCFSQGQKILRAQPDDSIYYAKPSTVTDLNFGGNNIKAGEIFQVMTTIGDTVLLINQNKITIKMSNYNADGTVTDLQYHFWTQKFVNAVKKKYGLANWNLVLKRKVMIGWNKEMCELSWGLPNDINKTIAAGVNNEQWVYNSSYLYFSNGKLTTIQN